VEQLNLQPTGYHAPPNQVPSSSPFIAHKGNRVLASLVPMSISGIGVLADLQVTSEPCTSIGRKRAIANAPLSTMRWLVKDKDDTKHVSAWYLLNRKRTGTVPPWGGAVTAVRVRVLSRARAECARGLVSLRDQGNCVYAAYSG
jgi:hypothetical protein